MFTTFIALLTYFKRCTSSCHYTSANPVVQQCQSNSREHLFRQIRLGLKQLPTALKRALHRERKNGFDALPSALHRSESIKNSQQCTQLTQANWVLNEKKNRHNKNIEQPACLFIMNYTQFISVAVVFYYSGRGSQHCAQVHHRMKEKKPTVSQRANSPEVIHGGQITFKYLYETSLRRRRTSPKK